MCITCVCVYICLCVYVCVNYDQIIENHDKYMLGSAKQIIASVYT